MAILLSCLAIALGGCTFAQFGTATPPRAHRPSSGGYGSWVVQLQGYPHGKLDGVAVSGADLAVVDLARDAARDYFTRSDIDALHRRGMTVLAYFEIGSIEDFRPAYPVIQQRAPDLVLNEWQAWPGEYFVKYWDARWWDLVIRKRLDRAAAAGFDGVYLDTPLAYEQIDLALVPGQTRASLAGKMVDLIAEIGAYAHAGGRNLLVVPQNSPELGYLHFDDPSSGPNPEYLAAIDGIGMEELYYLATDEPCTQPWCPANLAATRMLASHGKFVLSIDYAVKAADVKNACRRAQSDGFTEYVTTVALDSLSALCGA